MDYIRVTITTKGDGIEAVVGALSAIDIDQVEIIEDEETIRRYLEEIADTWDYSDPKEILKGTEPCVRVYVPIETDHDNAMIQVQDIKDRMAWLAKQDFGIDMGELMVFSDVVREEDWANNWKQYYKPLRIGKHLVVKPTWEQYTPIKGDKILEIDPGMAFGTGTHETTALCLEAIEKYLHGGETVLDIGCGSGILSIGAMLCGASKVTAIDIDAVAVRVAKENIDLNHMSASIECSVGDLLKDHTTSVDVTIANIVADVILRLLPAAFAHTNQGGLFLTSGIIDEREQEIRESALSMGFIHKETFTRGCWRAMVFARD